MMDDQHHHMRPAASASGLRRLILIAVMTTAITLLLPAMLLARVAVHHDLAVHLLPDGHRIIGSDTVTLEQGAGRQQVFFLHRGLNPVSPTPGVAMVAELSAADTYVQRVDVTLPEGLRTFVVEYSGSIDHALIAPDKEQARGFQQTYGMIGPEGIYLSGRSFWYPRWDGEAVTFDLRTTLPDGWRSVSQGTRGRAGNGHVVVELWECKAPQEEIFLVANRFTEYVRPGDRIQNMVFLSTPDQALADRYLDGTAGYVAMYEKLIGPYPYGKFALVENFWETGYGMPSFTLLGPKVVRLPFILYTSYPHEILHNWWGNSVFPDYAKGNWSEGLTAYLADHLIKEQRGQGRDYRLSTLQNYGDYVSVTRDFPLARFVSRHGSSSAAIGYGKSLMFFHMLRRQLGDPVFIAGLQRLYRDFRFKTATFDDLRTSFEQAAGVDLSEAFNQWVNRVGAPELRVNRANWSRDNNDYLLNVELEQVQPDEVFRLQVPLVVTMAGIDQATQTTVAMTQRRQSLELRLPARPVRVDVDPEFDLFRRLHQDEMPPALTAALGAEHVLVVLPSAADDDPGEAYRDLALSLARSGPDRVDVVEDSSLDHFPADRDVILIGWRNRFRDRVGLALASQKVVLNDTGVRIGAELIPRHNHSVVLTARQLANPKATLTWMAVDPPTAANGLARKLPHYHKYSYLGFEGDEPVNVFKGRWPVLTSPLTVFVPDEDGSVHGVAMGALPAREPLIQPESVFSGERMLATVRDLADEALQGRGFGSQGLDRAAAYIADQFVAAGLLPAGDAPGEYLQQWQATGGDPKTEATLKNVVAVIPGSNPAYAGQSVVLGAHYDHLGLGWPDGLAANRGKVHPGADDNASGVAVLIELARLLGGTLQPERSVVFVAFSGEEAGRLGSQYYLTQQTRYPADKIIGMVNLDTVGRLHNRKLLVLGSESAMEWVHIMQGAGMVTGVKVQTVAEPLDASDQQSFHDHGVPAIQLFSGPHPDYHRPTDTPDRLDGSGLVKVAMVTKEAITYLAARPESLTSTLTATPAGGVDEVKPPRTPGVRKVSLGTIPDFGYQGAGYRIEGVAPGSPAEACGLMSGDVLIAINGAKIGGLRDLSQVLKGLAPNDQIIITFERQGREMTVETVVRER